MEILWIGCNRNMMKVVDVVWSRVVDGRRRVCTRPGVEWGRGRTRNVYFSLPSDILYVLTKKGKEDT